MSDAILAKLEFLVNNQKEVNADVKELAKEVREGFAQVDLRLDRNAERLARLEEQSTSNGGKVAQLEKQLEKKADAKLVWWLMGIVGALFSGMIIFIINSLR